MDCSPEYGKMCEKAVEIQGFRKVIAGDYYWRNSESVAIVFGSRDAPYFVWSNAFDREYHWLPTQDQLQEMIETRPSPKLFVHFITFLGWGGESFNLYQYPQTNAGTVGFTSMEQLWLAFVMKEKFGKIWDGENWTKERGT